MLKNILFLSLVVAIMLVFALPSVAFAAEGASDCGKDYGALHRLLATSGATGQGPNRGGHVPGQAHDGAAGICLGMDVGN